MNNSAIKILCDKKKITFKSLAEKIGMSETGFHQMIKGNSMKVSALEAISAVLGVSPAYFWQSENDVAKEVDRVFDALKDIVKQKIG